MISEKVIDYFSQKFPGLNGKLIFQDYTDDEIREAIVSCKPHTANDLVNYLLARSNDNEVKAHLQGYSSCTEKRSLLIELASQFVRSGKNKDWIISWWNSKVDARNPLTQEEVETIWNKRRKENL